MGSKTERNRSFIFSKPGLGKTVNDTEKANCRNLHALASQFDVLKIKLSQLIESLQNHHQALGEINRTRLKVAEKISALAAQSPLSEHAGLQSDEIRDDVTLSNLDSYLDIHRNLNLRLNMYIERYSEHIVQYSLNWFHTVDKRVSTSIKNTKKLQKDFEHYEAKCNRLRFDKRRVTTLGNRGEANLNLQSKLDRNERKLQNAKDEFQFFFEETKALVHEVTKNCWKYLFPILMKLTQFNASLVSDEKKLLGNLEYLSKSLTKLQKSYNVSPERRMLALENDFDFQSDSSDEDNSEVSSGDDDEESTVSVIMSHFESAVNGIQGHLKSYSSGQSNMTPQTSNTREEISVYTDTGNTTINSFLADDSPKVEVGISDENPEHLFEEKSSSLSSRRFKFSGKALDQNASTSVLKHKIRKNKRSSTESYCVSKVRSSLI